MSVLRKEVSMWILWTENDVNEKLAIHKTIGTEGEKDKKFLLKQQMFNFNKETLCKLNHECAVHT